MSRKIAPTLTWHIQDPFASDPAAFREAIPEMVRELRALLAVARAAENMFPPANWTLPTLRPSEKRLARALSRLTPPRRTGGGR
jgi:hypothetical protein